MKNKKVLLTIVFAALCAVVILAVLLIGYHKKKTEPTQYVDPGAVRSFDSLEEAVEWAEFSLHCSDRLSGVLATGYSADKTAITVTYGKAGFVSKTLILEETENGETKEPEGEDLTAVEINGLTVWLTGGDSAVSKAEWIDNGFDYVITLTDQGTTVDIMTDYILATR